MDSVPEVTGTIYALSCSCHPERGVRYVGQTRYRPEARLRGHIQDAKNGKKSPVQFWIRKHGTDQILIDVIENCSHEDLDDRELFWIAFYREAQGRSLMNVRLGGSNTPLAEETKRKIGDANRGKVMSAESREKMRLSALAAYASGRRKFVARLWTDDERLAWSEKMTGEGNGFFGKTHTAETLAKIAEQRPSMVGENNPFFGKTHTPEAVEKIKAANVGRVQPASELLAKSLAFRGGKNPATSLTDEDAVSIYETYKAGGLTQSEVGSLFGVQQVVVSNIALGRTWKHLGLEPIRGKGGRKASSDLAH